MRHKGKEHDVTRKSQVYLASADAKGNTTLELDTLPSLSALPIWNTPPEWCTSIGEGIMSNTVPVYINTISFDGDDDNDRSMSTEEKVGKRRVASFISDNRRRDVQTALAMMSGMAEEIAR